MAQVARQPLLTRVYDSPTHTIPGSAGGTNTSDDVGGIALVVLTETRRQMGPEARKATGEGIYWQSSRMDAQNGTEDHRLRKASGCRRIPNSLGTMSGWKDVSGRNPRHPGTYNKNNKSVQDRTQIRKGIGRAGVLRRACRFPFYPKAVSYTHLTLPTNREV